MDPSQRWQYYDIPFCEAVQTNGSIRLLDHNVPIDLLSDDDLNTCQVLSSQSANDYKFTWALVSGWSKIKIDMHYLNFLAISRRRNVVADINIDKGQKCNSGLLKLCQSVNAVCSFECQCRIRMSVNSCNVVSLRIVSGLKDFHLCEIKAWY
ncbi:hypothetical protein CAPTEDRAFT_205422 [Capitella teleta]|uniref:Uncharacterized protein n=1 Tax=Capitella teleta TaxID=283909 RepID=R7TDI4_CAPTE|nr:hypothetical protein CAPTEDRAFT_205422 [Capitella teleta]|eukprot:ELT91779.1 hypothetical protein CAPTEDRAFT_205422 [Capitella teleta]